MTDTGNVYWMGRPPYLRWFIVGVLVIGSLAYDARAPATELYPLAARDLDAGTVLTAADISYTAGPTGVLPLPTDTLGRTVRLSLDRGVPLGEWLLDPVPALPPDTWAIDLAMPSHVGVGDPVRVVWSSGPETRSVDGFALRSGVDGSAAIPAQFAADVADAVRRGQVTVLTQPGR